MRGHSSPEEDAQQRDGVLLQRVVRVRLRCFILAAGVPFIIMATLVIGASMREAIGATGAAKAVPARRRLAAQAVPRTLASVMVRFIPELDTAK